MTISQEIEGIGFRAVMKLEKRDSVAAILWKKGQRPAGRQAFDGSIWNQWPSASFLPALEQALQPWRARPS